ncbi:GH24242 [Drosophila grimshawi]|uniref:GH24242 n=1 Tax=Drosophila grimshawi TaxID=7222 RepID=B4JMY1_DROGR|nr:GH24242 [Drosophila grimshawi]
MNPEKTNSIAEQANQASGEAAAAPSGQESTVDDGLMDEEQFNRRWEEQLHLQLNQMHKNPMRVDKEPAKHLGPLKEKVIRVGEERGDEATFADVMSNQPPTHVGRNFLAFLQLAQEKKITMQKPEHPDEPLNPEELRFKLNPQSKRN